MPVLRERDRIEGDLDIEVAFTGVGLDVGDHAPASVRERALAAVALESRATPVVMHQVHGADVVVIDADREHAAQDEPAHADALITRQPGVALLARAADCVPVLVADPFQGAVAAVHAGRQGVVAGVVPAAVAGLAARSAESLVAWVGPHICGGCYEVPQQMQDDVVAVAPAARSTTTWGTPGLDLGAAVRAQLADAGIQDVREVGSCTLEDERWPSYRRDGAAATRFAGVVWMSR